jgi:hypothetical protein
MKIKVIRDTRVQTFEENVNNFLSVIDNPKHAYRVVDVKLHMSVDGVTNHFNALITYEKTQLRTMTDKEREAFREENRYTPEETAQLKTRERTEKEEFAAFKKKKSKALAKAESNMNKIKEEYVDKAPLHPKDSTKAPAKA